MRHVARILAASVAASLLSVTAPAHAAPTTGSAGIVAPSASTTDSSGQTAAQKRLAKKKAAALKKKRAAVAKKKAAIAKKKRLAKKRAKIVRVAAKYKGTPYKWGGTTPSGFDCSGYVKYVVKKALKKKMPRLAGDQMKKGKKVAKGKKKKGDLIGFYSGSYVYHIAIYAGDGKIWHAPRPGKSVEKVKIWTGAYKVRRL